MKPPIYAPSRFLKIIMELLNKRFFACLVVILFFKSQTISQNTGSSLQSIEAHFIKITESNLADFSPENYKKIQSKIHDLHGTITRGGQIPDSELRILQSDIESFRRIATKISKCLKKPYRLRQIATANDFIRGSDPMLFHKANEEYKVALNYANNQDFGKAKPHAKQAKRAYQTLIEAAQRQLKQQYKPIIDNYQKIIKADLKALNAGPDDSGEIEVANSITARVNLDNFGLGRPLNDLHPPVFPPPPAPPGPIPPDAVIIDARFADSIRIAWFDKSDNETGNRVVRYSTVGQEIVIGNLGALEKFEKHYYTDTFNIDPESEYCYRIVSFNDEGSRATNPKCIYSASTETIPALRLRVRITVDDAKDADCDCTLVVGLGQWREGFGSDTYLNYSHDDFEKGSVFTYDLNIGDIKNLFDITEILITNNQDYSSDEDKVRISKVEFFANWANDFWNGGETQSDSIGFHKFFEQEWEGESKVLGTVKFELNEIRNNPAWLSYSTSFQNISNTVLIPTRFPMHSLEDGFIEIFIPENEIVSRIESIVGHNGEKGIDYETDHGMETINFEWKKRFNASNITVKNDTTIKISMSLNPYNLGESTDSRLVSFIKDAAPGPFKVEGEFIISLKLDTLLNVTDTVINKIKLRDTTIIFMLGGFAKVDNIMIDGRPSIGATIIAGFLLRGKGLGAFFADPIFDFVADCLALDEIPKTIEKRFDPPIELGRVRKANLEGFSFNPDEIRVYFDEDGNLHGCCVDTN